MDADSGKASPTTPVPTLEYGRRQRFSWVGRHRKLLILLAFFAAIGLTVWQQWQPIKTYVLWRYWLHQAIVFQMPDKAIDLRVDRLATAGQAGLVSGDYALDTMGGGSEMVYLPVFYRRLWRYDPRLHLVERFPTPLAFLGTLWRSDGQRRLVVVTSDDGFTSGLLNGVSVLVLPLPRWNEPWPRGVTVVSGLMQYPGPPLIPTRLRSGVIDPNDPSKVAFEFIVGSSTSAFSTITGGGVIDAQLQNDDTLKFTLRSVPSDRPNISLGEPMANGDLQTVSARVGPIYALQHLSSTAPATGP